MDLPDGFELAACWQRADPRDAFVSNHHGSIDELPEGAVVGTSSLRRARATPRPLARAADRAAARQPRHAARRSSTPATTTAIVLAAAGLKRLGLATRIRSPLPPSLMLPAPGQGAITVEILASDRATRDRLAVLDDAVTRLAVTAERAAARKVAGSCHAPFAAHARFGSDRRLRLEALVADDAGRISRSEGEADVATEAEAIALGEDVAGRLDWSGPAQ